MSAAGLAALAVAQGELAKGVKGGDPAKFRGPQVDVYLASVGLDAEHEGANGEGYPWCAAFVHWCFQQSTAETLPNPCPKTGVALHLWDLSPLQARTQLPAPGDVFIVDHGKGRGHCGIVSSVSPDSQTITSIEGDTSADGSRTGDAVGEHLWRPSDGARGRLVGYLELG